MTQETQREKGFTLLEMILVLTLLGVMGAVAGMGIVSAVEGLVYTRLNATTLQKGQMAVARLTKEFKNISSVTSAGSTFITFSAYKEGVLGTHTVAVAGNTLTLDADVLTDQLNGFDLGFYDSYGSAKQTTWTSSRRIIEITIRLTGAGGVVSEFKDRVTPRNL